MNDRNTELAHDIGLGTQAVAKQEFLRQVFAWMFSALALTTAIAIWFNANSAAQTFFKQHNGLVIASIFAQLGLVIVLTGALNRLSVRAAAILFYLYAALTGVVFSIILSVYTTSSVVGAFAGAAGLFGGMAVYGYATKKDLSSWGPILFGALIGLIVASVVFMFVGGSTLNLVIGWVGVLIFSGLTAYDMQQLSRMQEAGFENDQAQEKLAIFGALRLYLDFINLFLMLLRIFGNTR